MEGVYERHIKPVLHDFAGKPFEGLCREWMWRESAAGRLPFRARAVGRWWDRQDYDFTFTDFEVPVTADA